MSDRTAASLPERTLRAPRLREKGSRRSSECLLSLSSLACHPSRARWSPRLSSRAPPLSAWASRTCALRLWPGSTLRAPHQTPRAHAARSVWSQCSHAVFPLSDPFRIGKYSVKGTIYDPLNLASTYDNNWLREAEIKHGRVCMLAFAGYVANDAGIKFPGKAFEGLSSLDAHDAMVKSGHMWALLFIVGVCEALHMSVVVPKLDGDWGDYEPGNYGLDPLKMATPSRRLAELKNGRLAMLGFSGLVTQAALGHAAPYW